MRSSATTTMTRADGLVGPLDIQERWFRRHGDAKGISFDETGSKVYVTFQSEDMPWRRKVFSRIKNTISFGLRSSPGRNGIAVFGIDDQGRFTRGPLWKKVFREFCRLENVHVHGDRAVVSNPDSHCVQLHDLRSDHSLGAPSQVLSETLVFPHGAKISPDGNLLVVTDFGIETVGHKVQWTSFVSPRKDRLVVFKLQSA